MQNPLNKLRMIVWLATLVVGCGELGQVDPGSALQVDALDVADAADPEMETLRSSTCEKHALGDDPYEDNDSMSAAWTGGMVANWENESLCEGYGCAVQGSDDDWYRIYVDQEHVTVSYENHYDGGAMSLEVYNNEGALLVSTTDQVIEIDPARVPAYLFVRVPGDDCGGAYDLLYFDSP